MIFFAINSSSVRLLLVSCYPKAGADEVKLTLNAGFITIFPILYIPTLSTVVFKHKGISWEWAVVFIAAFLFVVGVELHKWCKRIYFRRNGEGSKKSDMFERYLSTDSRDLSELEKA